ncbi:MAG: DUF488 domain-containing protein [Spirochaetia bacterium]|nr:DUF488 domain-containing protein [Spirochaetia bacterium]
MVSIKHVYEAYGPDDGERYLVDRLWPRGMSKEKLVMQAWIKEVAPSGDLRKWFGHELAKWEEFQQRYRSELDSNPNGLQPLVEAARRGKVTLLYAAHDGEHNNAVVLKEYLEKHIET